MGFTDGAQKCGCPQGDSGPGVSVAVDRSWDSCRAGASGCLQLFSGLVGEDDETLDECWSPHPSVAPVPVTVVPLAQQPGARGSCSSLESPLRQERCDPARLLSAATPLSRAKPANYCASETVDAHRPAELEFAMPPEERTVARLGPATGDGDAGHSPVDSLDSARAAALAGVGPLPPPPTTPPGHRLCSPPGGGHRSVVIPRLRLEALALSPHAAAAERKQLMLQFEELQREAEAIDTLSRRDGEPL